ncbi:MAG: hypothetical protein HJHJAOHD_00896 [Flavobacteriales bacterium]|nr:hypothetical protein [Flavobacteriales bacterium]
MNYDVAKIRKELTNLVDKLKEQSDNVSNMEHVPSLEINVMMARVNRLYEKAVLYKHILIAEENLKEQISAQPLSINEPIAPVVETLVDTPAPTAKVENTSLSSTQSLKSETNIPEKRKSSILDGTPISNIKKYLGINERYLFANELFKGKMEDLMNAIDEIENQSSFENAQGLIKTKWANSHQWDEDNAQVISFYKIVERRFL